MKILITGGAGFIGSHLVDELINTKHEIVVMDDLSNGEMANLSNSVGKKNFVFHQVSILDNGQLNDIMESVDLIYHLACLGVRHSLHSPIINHNVNAGGTLRVLECAIRNNVKKLFYISTSEVYGKTPKFPINENSPTNPTTVYGVSKLAGEYYTKAYTQRYGLNTLIIRLFNNYGPRAHYAGDAGELIPRSILRILSGINPIIYGDGEQTRDFLFVNDTARILTNLLHGSFKPGEILNVGTGREVSIISLIHRLIQSCGQDVSIDFHDPRPADVPRLWVDNGKFRKLYNNFEFTDFDVGFNKTIDYYEQLMQSDGVKIDFEEKNWMA